MRVLGGLALVLGMALVSPTAAQACDVGAEPAGVLDLYLTSVSLREAGDLEGAAYSLEQARGAVPDDVDLALELARVYAADRRYGAAAAAYAEAALLAPDRLDLALEQARFHLGGGFRVYIAAEAAARAARLAPHDSATIALLDRARDAAALASGGD